MYFKRESLKMLLHWKGEIDTKLESPCQFPFPLERHLIPGCKGVGELASFTAPLCNLGTQYPESKQSAASCPHHKV